MKHYEPTPDAATEIERAFTYHKPKEDQPERYDMLRETGGELAHLIATSTPAGREQSLALTKLKEAVMWANAAIACNE